MTLRQDLTDKVADIAWQAWDVSPGRVVPELRAIPLGNVAKTLSACVMYADLSGSTAMVNRVVPTAAAEYYKAFLHCASSLITANDGVIEAYDGDRVMGVFLGTDKERRAVTAALQLTDAIRSIVNPAFHARYTDHQDLKFTVGIDSSDVMVCKAGVRGDNDLVWVGSAPNVAAKLNSFRGLDHNYPTRVTSTVYAELDVDLLRCLNGALAWEGPFNDLGGPLHYRTLTWLPLL